MTTVVKLKVFPELSANDAARVKTRQQLDGEGNATSSLTDAAFTDFRNNTVGPEDARRLGDSSFRLERTLPLIETHVEKRVALMFIQAVVCHLSPYQFREGHTIHQGFHAPTLHYGGEKITMNAAHSATIPSLVAKNLETEKENIFLYRSHIYDENNSTIDMGREVNDADRAIDEKYTTSQLRTKTITILNQTATGSITPVDAAKQFVTTLVEEIDVALQREKKQEVIEVLKVYRQEAISIGLYLQEPDSFDLMLNVDLKDPEEKAIAKTVEELKAGQAPDRDQVLMIIKKKIDEVPVIIRRQLHEKENIAHTPYHFYALYHVWLLSCFPEEDRSIVAEALGINQQTLYAQAADFKLIGKTSQLLSKHVDKINAVAQEVLTLTRHLRGEPVDFNELEGLSPEKQSALRPAIFQLQYRIIKESQVAESAIKSKIEDTLHNIKKVTRASNLEIFFYKAILDTSSKDTAEKISKLLNISRHVLATKARELKCDSIAHRMLENNGVMISSLSKQIQKVSQNPTEEDKIILRNQIIAVHDFINPRRARTLFTPLYYKRLYEQNESPAAKNLIAEIINYSESTIDETIQRHTKDQTAEEYLAAHKEQILDIQIIALEKIIELRRETAVFRRELFVDLLSAPGKKEKEFQAEYKKRYPGAPMSNGTLYNLKNGIKYLDGVIIERVCAIFGQNKSLFYPSHFAE